MCILNTYIGFYKYIGNNGKISMRPKFMEMFAKFKKKMIK